MDPEVRKSLIEIAENDLRLIRGSLLLCVHDEGSLDDLGVAVRKLESLRERSHAFEMHSLGELAADIESGIYANGYPNAVPTDQQIFSTLDRLSEIERLLIHSTLETDDSDFDVGNFVDESFRNINISANSPVYEAPAAPSIAEDEFEIDESLLEVFCGEASELLNASAAQVGILANDPSDRDALWEIRRKLHTFKGAAGIAGRRQSSELAHNIEDMLFQLQDSDLDGFQSALGLINDAISLLLRSIQFDRDGEPSAAFADLENRLASHLNGARNGTGARQVNAKSTSPDNPVNDAKPTVRVSLDRLDALAKTLHQLAADRASIEPRMADAEDHEDLFARLQQQFRSLRLVAFKMLAPRFIRAVRMTCEEEGKRAELIIENGDTEIDTRLLDSLVEPLLHLLRNAVVHGIEPPETRRLLGKREVGRVTLRIDADGPDTLIRVSDDGAGVDLAALKRKAVENELISEGSAVECDDAAALQLLFLRGLTTSTKLNINAGRGVGMSIVKESVESQSGTIEVETTRQRGTTFAIRIKDSSLDSSSSSSSFGPGILVVDDSPTIRRLTSRMLANSGFKVTTAEDGVDALDRLNTHKQHPDLIISDVEMPRMNGFELLASVRGDERFCHIPVVIITSLSDAAYRRKAEEKGARAFLRKPINEPELLRVINECIGRSAEAAR